MNYIKKIILILLDLNFLLKKTFFKRKLEKTNQVRLLIYHDINSEKKLNDFEFQINSLKEKFDFISPQEFEESHEFKGKKILLTFDDGFKSNRIVAEKILEKYQIKAIFFILSDFIETKKGSLEYFKILNNIYPMGPKKEQISNIMDKEDIEFLLKNGHSIGCHTATHLKLSNIKDHETLLNEIINSKIKIEKKFGIKIKHFAYPFGDFKSINEKSLKILFNHYDYIHTGLRGNNILKKKLIFRDSSNPEMKISRLNVFLNNGADFIYSGKFNKLIKHLD